MRRLHVKVWVVAWIPVTRTWHFESKQGFGQRSALAKSAPDC
jgi:hypothetical protein